MPRKTKEKDEEKVVKKKSTTSKTSTTKKSSSSKKVTTTKKAASKKESASKKVPKKTLASSKKVVKDTPSKSKVEKKTTKTKVTASKKSTTAKSKSVKEPKKKVATKTTKKVATKKVTKKTTTSRKKKIDIVEYYDLPYRYNQTVVRLLTQTPNTLFVYWDISDKDKEKYIKEYGEYFFNNTKPVLVVHNLTKGYSFELDINDFANSWYLHVNDSSCDYQVELGRRPINEYVQIDNNYLYITTSNNMTNQNDHILLDKLSHFVYFRNVKTNELIKKNVTLSLLKKLGKIDSIRDFYKKLYPDEEIDFDKLDLKNPSSSSVFK